MTIMEMLFDQKTVQEMHERSIIKEARAEGRIEGIAEGRIEGERNAILALVRDGDLSAEKGAAKLCLTTDELLTLLNSVSCES